MLWLFEGKGMQKGLQVEKVAQMKQSWGSLVAKFWNTFIIWFFSDLQFLRQILDLAAAEAVFSRISLPALRFQFIADKTLGQQRLVGCPVDSSWGATGANVPYYHLSLHFGLVGPETIWKYKWN